MAGHTCRKTAVYSRTFFQERKASIYVIESPLQQTINHYQEINFLIISYFKKKVLTSFNQKNNVFYTIKPY